MWSRDSGKRGNDASLSSFLNRNVIFLMIVFLLVELGYEIIISTLEKDTVQKNVTSLYLENKKENLKSWVEYSISLIRNIVNTTIEEVSASLVKALSRVDRYPDLGPGPWPEGAVRLLVVAQGGTIVRFSAAPSLEGHRLDSPAVARMVRPIDDLRKAVRKAVTTGRTVVARLGEHSLLVEDQIIAGIRYDDANGQAVVLYVPVRDLDIRLRVATEIAKIKIGKEGYIFINRLDGTAIASNGMVIRGNKKLWEIFGPEDRIRRIFQMEYQASAPPQGGFMRYRFVKLTDLTRRYDKLSFVKRIPELGWIVGTGVYLDEIGVWNSQVGSILDRTLIQRIAARFTASILMWLFLVFIIKYLTTRISKETDRLLQATNRALNGDVPIDQDAFAFSELKYIAAGLNTLIEARKEVVRELEEERQRLSVTLHSIGDGLITTDAQGRVTLLNGVAQQLTGWSQQDAVGRPLKEVFRIVDAKTGQEIPSPVDKVLDTGTIVELGNNTILISKDGSKYHITDSAAPIKTPEGEITGVVLVFRDVTEKKKFEAEVLRARNLQSLGTLAGGIAHDFNNLLTGLFGNLELAAMDLGEDHPAAAALANAHKALDRAKALTQQLLTFAKGGAPVTEVVRLPEFLKEVVSFNLSGTNVRAHFDFADDLWPVYIDRNQFSQVVGNLVMNAVQAMEGSAGHLYVSAHNVEDPSSIPTLDPERKYIELTFRDTGHGIPPEYLDMIFDPYFTTKEHGSGLGLAIVHSIVTAHDGRIVVDSEVGKGTTFHIYLPAADGSVEEDEEHEMTRPGNGIDRMRILVLDDEELIRNLMVKYLRRLGHSVEQASTGGEAVELYRKAMDEGRPFDLVFTDLTLQGSIGGHEVIRILRKMDPDVRAIVISGYSNDPVIARYEEFGFMGRLMKPFTLQELRHEMDRVLGMS